VSSACAPAVGAPAGSSLLPAFAALTAFLCALAPTPARAGTEEFSTFSVEAQEEDDESLLDHVLVQAPYAWNEEWLHATQAFRTEQGCFTSGQWYNSLDLKLRSPLGERVYFGLDVTQREDDRTDYQFVDLSFHFPTRFGTAVGMFRPFHDKSRQDFAVMWDVGADTSAFQLRTTFGLEDFFNNLWAFRQTRVGNLAEPYQRHPWEPGFSLAVRRPRWRAEAGGRYLTPSRKLTIISYADPSLDHLSTLWGTYGWASLAVNALGASWELNTVNHQAASGEWIAGQPALAGHDYRRQWWIETIARRPLSRRWSGEVHWLYQERSGNVASPNAPRMFEGIDRLIQAEALYTMRPSLAFRFGAMRDRIGIAQRGVSLPFSYGTRNETRGYIALMARFGRVSLEGIEGIELDHEPYAVWFVHDKGFLQLQTTF
jgi:hypothetical protein